MRRLTSLAAAAAFIVAANANAQNVPVYENTINYTGFAYANAGSGVIGTNNVITTLVADDINFNSPAINFNVVGFKFSVANFNGTAVSARPRLRFYNNDGSGGGPGTFITQVNFGAISFGSGVTVFTVTGVNFNVDGTFWAGITFDNNSGATGATQAQMDNLGQGIFNPPVLGSSQDLFFKTSTFGDFASSNPAGGFFFFNGNPVANFGFQFIIQVPEPSTFLMVGALLPVAGLWMHRRRRALAA